MWPKRKTQNTTSSMVAKNLGKSDLGGVIFGCKNNTIAECLSKQLFGMVVVYRRALEALPEFALYTTGIYVSKFTSSLPSMHFSYVKNIEPGLPLFLFNYSERKMYGIFEAASCGQLNIDPYAWTNGGKDKTAFPAQVQIRIQRQYHPLPENEFKKAIAGNYHSFNHFYFELNHAQTKHLIGLFKSSPQSGNILSYPGTLREGSFHTSKWHDNCNLGTNSTCIKLDTSANACSETECRRLAVPLDQGFHNKEYVNLDKLFSGLPTGDKCQKEHSVPEYANTDCYTSGAHLGFFCFNKQKQMVSQDKLPSPMDSEEVNVLHKLHEYSAYKIVQETPNSDVSDTAISYDPSRAPEDAGNTSKEPSDFSEIEKATLLPHNHENAELLEIIKKLNDRASLLEKKQAESQKGVQLQKNIVMVSEKDIQSLKDYLSGKEDKLKPSTSLSDDNLSNSLSEDLSSRTLEKFLGSDKVIYLIGGYNGCRLLSSLDSFNLSADTITNLKPMNCARSFASTAILNGSFYLFGGGNGCDSWFDSVEHYDKHNDEWTWCPPLLGAKGGLAGATVNEKIYAVGGGDQQTCFSDVEMFDPALGRWLKTRPMFYKRFALTAAELHGALYAVGGYDGEEYLRSVERYDPREGFWIRLPSMSSRRACHSMAIMNEKFYVMGGHNGEMMVPSMEIFDPRFGYWVMGEPMNSSRGYSDAAVVGDCLVMIGGVERDRKTVDIVEFYREGSRWITGNVKSVGRRSFFSAVVL